MVLEVVGVLFVERVARIMGMDLLAALAVMAVVVMAEWVVLVLVAVVAATMMHKRRGVGCGWGGRGGSRSACRSCC
jgi:hypothetical protein